MWPIAISHIPWESVICVSLSVGHIVGSAKMAEPIWKQFGAYSCGPKEPVIKWGCTLVNVIE